MGWLLSVAGLALFEERSADIFNKYFRGSCIGFRT